MSISTNVSLPVVTAKEYYWPEGAHALPCRKLWWQRYVWATPLPKICPSIRRPLSAEVALKRHFGQSLTRQAVGLPATFQAVGGIFFPLYVVSNNSGTRRDSDAKIGTHHAEYLAHMCDKF